MNLTCACGHCSRPQLSVDALRTLERAQRFIHSAVAATHSLMMPSSTVQHTRLTPLLVQHQQLELENGRGSASLHLAECERLVCVKTLKKGKHGVWLKNSRLLSWKTLEVPWWEGDARLFRHANERFILMHSLKGQIILLKASKESTYLYIK